MPDELVLSAGRSSPPRSHPSLPLSQQTLRLPPQFSPQCHDPQGSRAWIPRRYPRQGSLLHHRRLARRGWFVRLGLFSSIDTSFPRAWLICFPSFFADYFTKQYNLRGRQSGLAAFKMPEFPDTPAQTDEAVFVMRPFALALHRVG